MKAIGKVKESNFTSPSAQGKEDSILNYQKQKLGNFWAVDEKESFKMFYLTLYTKQSMSRGSKHMYRQTNILLIRNNFQIVFQIFMNPCIA